MCIKIPPRNKETVNRYKRIVKKHKRKLKNSDAHFSTLSKLNNQSITKVRSKIDDVFIDETLKQQYAKFSLIYFEKKELCSVGSLLDKIVYCYQITKSQNIDLLNSIYHVNFKGLWKKISKTLHLQKLKASQNNIAYFHQFYKKYLLPFETYLFDRKIMNFTHLRQPNSFSIHPTNLTKNFISSHFENLSHTILHFTSPLFLNPESFPILTQSIFKGNKSIKLSCVTAIQSIFKSKFFNLFLTSKSSRQQYFASIIKISERHKPPTFYGNRSSIFFNTTHKSVQWFIIEDCNLKKVAQQLKLNQQSLLENFHLIIENFSQLILKQCSITNLIQEPKQHLFLNAGCYAYPRSNQMTYLVQIPFEIKGSQQLNALFFRKSLLDNSSHKIPECAYKLRIFIQECASQQSFYLFQTHKFLRQRLNQQKISIMTLNINNVIEQEIVPLQDQNAFCKKCQNDILNYYYKKDRQIICIQCIQDLLQTNLKIYLRFQDTFLKGIFDKFKKMHLMHLKKQETVVENQRCTNYFKNLRPQHSINQHNQSNSNDQQSKIDQSNLSNQINDTNQSSEINQLNVKVKKQTLVPFQQTHYRSFLQIVWTDSNIKQVNNQYFNDNQAKSNVQKQKRHCIINIQENQKSNFTAKNKKKEKSKCNKQLSKSKNVSKDKFYTNTPDNKYKSRMKQFNTKKNYINKSKKSSMINKVTTDEQ